MTLPEFIKKKADGKKIAMLTAYDYTSARALEESNVDAILVGDSLGMVVLGYDSTVPVTMEEMLHHAKAVRRGAPKTFLIGDMPFLSYQVSAQDAVRNAGRFIKEARQDAVKIEGGLEVCGTVKAILDAGIPVLGHLGLTPQSATKLGGSKVQGKDRKSASYIYESAKALEDAGAFALVLECIPAELAKLISESLRIPTIGIGAGRHCDGQVLVLHDLLGLYKDFTPRFAKQYVSFYMDMLKAARHFKSDVETAAFPEERHSSHSQEADFLKFIAAQAKKRGRKR